MGCRGRGKGLGIEYERTERELCSGSWWIFGFELKRTVAHHKLARFTTSIFISRNSTTHLPRTYCKNVDHKRSLINRFRRMNRMLLLVHVRDLPRNRSLTKRKRVPPPAREPPPSRNLLSSFFQRRRSGNLSQTLLLRRQRSHLVLALLSALYWS